MTRRADKSFTKKVAGGMEPEQPALNGAVGSPEGYHSAREHSDFDYDSEEAQEVETEEDLTAESDNSDTSSIQLGLASIRSQCSTTANRDRKRTGG